MEREVTICLGLAASIGPFLLAGGTKGKRIALPNAEIMIHQPAIHGNAINGQVTDIKIVSDQLQKSKQRLNRILAANTGRSLEVICTEWIYGNIHEWYCVKTWSNQGCIV